MARKNPRIANLEKGLITPADPAPEQVARATELRQRIAALRAGTAGTAAKPSKPATPREFTDAAADAAKAATAAKRKRR